MKKTITIIYLFFFVGFIFAQEQPLIKHSPNGFFDKVFNGYGKEYSLEELRVDTNTKDPISGDPKSVMLCSTGYFDLYFEVGSGMEGNSGTEVARRNVLCQVFSDLSQFIVPANPNVKVNILVRNINTELPGYHPISNPNPSQTSGVLGLATGFYVVPLTTPPVSGIADNEIWKTINSGVDSYTSVASPLMANAAGAMF